MISMGSRGQIGVVAVMLALSASVVSAGPDNSGTAPEFPLKKSPNGRYLVDRKGKPFLISGDAPQALTVNVSESEADVYFANRKSHGFNALWVNLLCRPGTGGRKDGATFDGILPFSTPDDLSAPNEPYFARCDRMIGLAAKHGLLIILDPCEAIDHLSVMRANGVEKCRAFGQYLGSRYARFDNILWMSGNDFQAWKDPANDAVALALAQGIREKDRRHLQTVELNYHLSSSLDDPNWAKFVDVNAVYTYYPPYAKIIEDYKRTNPVPMVMIESDYEFENGATPLILRKEEYWSVLSGAAGQVYGNAFIWPFKAGWKENLDTPGAIQMAHQKALFESRRWYDLIPDLDHTVITGGYGTFDPSTTDATRFVMKSDYVTAGRTPDGALVIAYLPSEREVTVDMTRLRGPVTAKWFDPSRGTYTQVAGSPFPNTGSHAFTPPGKNGDGDGDWVLVLEAARRAAGRK